MKKIIDATKILRKYKKKAKTANESLIDKALEYVRKFKNKPLAGKLLENLEKLLERLKENPRLWVIVAAALLYIIDPFDLTPDFVPAAGLVDDILVVAGVLKLLT